MRLLRLKDDNSFSLVEYLGSNTTPAYAILSHTWGPEHEEVTFRDLTEHDTTAKAKVGYRKLTFCASQAARDGLRYFWVDTCCINKLDAAELQEAINSMFRWYQNATRCYVYLSDVSKDASTSDDRSQRWKPEFRQSRWFARGWTLQELIAPKSVEFFSKEGTMLGNKRSLEQTIQEITGVAVHAIRGDALSQFSEEEILSWVTKRQTKREEDIVYCLLGFFGVFMPLLYGEGQQNALERLQEQTRKKSGHIEQSLHTEQRQMLQDSLRFDQIDARHMTIKNAHARTCKWFLECPKYLQWLDPAELDKHHGFLWIKGNPGTGKSTLMKFAAAHARRKGADREVVSFFFNARGEDLERSTVGTYRSLLLQLLEKSPRLLRVFDSLGLSTACISTEYNWSIEALETLLEQALRMLEKPTVCYIDALDECDERQIRELIAFFERMGEFVASSEIQFHICLSSRHYPHITIEKGIDLVLEGQEGHSQDITNYIQDKLKIGKSKLAQQIYTKLQQKASGIFMWVVLVVEILNKEHDRGRIHVLQRRLQEIPGDLHTLFRSILTRDSYSKKELLLCIQWVLFAAEPLSPVELYYAILSGVEPEALSAWDQGETTPDTIERFILDSSKGLTDITASKAQRVQFIHESVRDFLLKGDNLSDIWPELANNFHGTSHEALKQCCLNFMNAEIQGVSLAENPRSGMAPRQDRIYEERGAKRKVTGRLALATAEKCPFLPYAVNNVLYHADAAEGYGVTQNHLRHFALGRWIEHNNLFEKHVVRKYTKDVTLLYLLAERNLKNLIKASPSILDCLEVGNERYGPPIFASATCKSVDATRLFVEALRRRSSPAGSPDRLSAPQDDEQNICQEARRTFKYQRKRNILLNAVELGNTLVFGSIIDISRDLVDSADSQGRTPLWYAVKYGYAPMVKLLLATGVVRVDGDPSHEGSTPLLAAIKDVDAKTLGLLLRAKADVDAKRGIRDDLSQIVLKGGYEEVVKLLLNAGAKVTAASSVYRSALTQACHNGQRKLVKLLLDTGAEVDTPDHDGHTPLQVASTNGNKEVVELLLSAGAEVNKVGPHGTTPLQAASTNGNKEVVELLLSAGAEVNKVGPHGTTPLQAASTNGNKEIVELLLSVGAGVNKVGPYGTTALQVASTQGNKEVVELLLSAGANLNVKDKNLDTPLLEASRNGHKKVVELLLSAEADMNAWGGTLDASLQVASRNGHREVVELLVSAGAEVDKVSAAGDTPLQTASILGYTEVVELLVSVGADVNAQGGAQGTPIQAASKKGHKEVVKLLLSAGADANVKGDNLGTPLQEASRNDHKEVVKLLLSVGADANDKGGNLGTPLQEASRMGYKEVVELLLGARADVNAKGSTLATPLHEASMQGHKEVVELLLSAGADVNTIGGLGTALQRASTQGYKEVVELLLSARADVNAEGGTLGTPLYEASIQGHKEVVKLLKQAGANDSFVLNDSLPLLPSYGTEYYETPVFESMFPVHLDDTGVSSLEHNALPYSKT
jgi:ankyrin repeat protein